MVDCYVRFKGLIIHKSSVFVAWIVVSITASVEFWMKCVSNSSRFDVMNSPNNLLITPTNHVCCCVMKLGHKRLVVVWMDSQRSVLRQLWDEPMWSWKPRIQMQILEQNAVLGSTHQEHSLLYSAGQSTAKAQHWWVLSTVFGRSKRNICRLILRRGCDWLGIWLREMPWLMDLTAPTAPSRSMSTEGSTSRSRRINSCCNITQLSLRMRMMGGGGDWRNGDGGW